MTTDKAQIARIFNRLAATLALLVALALPLAYGLLAYDDLSDSLTFKAKVKASALNGLIVTTPDLWMYAENQLQGLISREPVLLEEERIRVLDAAGAVVAEAGLVTKSPEMTRSYPLHDAERVVGQIEVSGSLRDTAFKTLAAGLLGLLFGASVFGVMQVLPLRALRRVTDALLEEKEQGEALLKALQRREAALQASEENLSITLHSIGEAVIATDTGGRVTRMNPTAERLTGWALADARERPLAEVFRIVNADTRQTVADPVQWVMAHGQIVGLANHTMLLSRDGQEYQIADSAAPIRNAGGEIVGVVLVFSDVTEKYRIEATLHETQEILRAAMDQTPAGIAIADAPDGALRYLNDAGLAIRGEDRDSVVYGLGIDNFFSNRPVLDLDGQQLSCDEIPLARAIRFGETGAREFRIRRPDHSERTILSRAAPIRNALGEVVAGIAVFLDITESKIAEEKIKYLAFYDQLTGLPNRRLLFDRLAQALANRSRSHRQGALLFIDLDHFKALNDTLGHDFGDLLLLQVGQRLQTCVREGDSVARIGGDEFVVMLEGLSAIDAEAANQAELVGQKIQATLNQTYQLAQRAYQGSASIGITLFEDRLDIDELLKRADLAMYQAKGSGRNALRFFDPEIQALVDRHAALEADLREAISQGQFLIHYQPQIDGSGRTVAAEALLRWQHPRRGLVSPAEFIPLAEESGLILAIGQWVMDAACAQLADWARRPALDQLMLSVNVSARQFRHADFVSQVLAALERSDANPLRLKLELTESLLVDDVEDVIAKMSALKAQGVSFSLDDFGTGYSSLSYLKRLPFDQLKIDQSFVRELLVDANDAAIVRTIIALGQSLGLVVVAEGVETQEQKDCLASNGCRVYQGYFFSRPLPLASFERYAASGSPGASGMFIAERVSS